MQTKEVNEKEPDSTGEFQVASLSQNDWVNIEKLGLFLWERWTLKSHSQHLQMLPSQSHRYSSNGDHICIGGSEVSWHMFLDLGPRSAKSINDDPKPQSIRWVAVDVKTQIILGAIDAIEFKVSKNKQSEEKQTQLNFTLSLPRFEFANAASVKVLNTNEKVEDKFSALLENSKRMDPRQTRYIEKIQQMWKSVSGVDPLEILVHHTENFINNPEDFVLEQIAKSYLEAPKVQLTKMSADEKYEYEPVVRQISERFFADGLIKEPSAVQSAIAPALGLGKNLMRQREERAQAQSTQVAEGGQSAIKMQTTSKVGPQ